MHCHVFTTFFFLNDTAPTEIYTLSLHDALPICPSITILQISLLIFMCCSSTVPSSSTQRRYIQGSSSRGSRRTTMCQDRKSTRLNSSHGYISYAVFCLKKKKKEENQSTRQTKQR